MKRGWKRGLSFYIPGSLFNPHLPNPNQPLPILHISVSLLPPISPLTPFITPISLPLHHPPTPVNTNSPPTLPLPPLRTPNIHPILTPTLRAYLLSNPIIVHSFLSIILPLLGKKQLSLKNIFFFFLSYSRNQNSNSIFFLFLFFPTSQKEKETGI